MTDPLIYNLEYIYDIKLVCICALMGKVLEKGTLNSLGSPPTKMVSSKLSMKSEFSEALELQRPKFTS